MRHLFFIVRLGIYLIARKRIIAFSKFHRQRPMKSGKYAKIPMNIAKEGVYLYKSACSSR
jgi:hypothetical protein